MSKGSIQLRKHYGLEVFSITTIFLLRALVRQLVISNDVPRSAIAGPCADDIYRNK